MRILDCVHWLQHSTDTSCAAARPDKSAYDLIKWHQHQCTAALAFPAAQIVFNNADHLTNTMSSHQIFNLANTMLCKKYRIIGMDPLPSVYPCFLCDLQMRAIAKHIIKLPRNKPRRIASTNETNNKIKMCKRVIHQCCQVLVGN